MHPGEESKVRWWNDAAQLSAGECQDQDQATASASASASGPKNIDLFQFLSFAAMLLSMSVWASIHGQRLHIYFQVGPKWCIHTICIYDVADENEKLFKTILHKIRKRAVISGNIA